MTICVSVQAVGFLPTKASIIGFGFGTCQVLGPRVTLDAEKHRDFHPDGLHMLTITAMVVASHILVKSTSYLSRFAQRRGLPPSFFLERINWLRSRTGRLQILDHPTFGESDRSPRLQRVLSLAWHPGGNYLAVVCTEHDIHVWDLRKMPRVRQSCWRVVS